MIQTKTTATVKCDADNATLPADAKLYVITREIAVCAVTAEGVSQERELRDRQELCAAHFATAYPTLAVKLGI